MTRRAFFSTFFKSLAVLTLLLIAASDLPRKNLHL